MLGHRFFQPLTSFESLTAFAQLPEEASVFLYEECSLGHFKNNEEQWGLTQGAIYALFFFLRSWPHFVAKTNSFSF